MRRRLLPIIIITFFTFFTSCTKGILKEDQTSLNESDLQFLSFAPDWSDAENNNNPFKI